jgi:hypothetical protein
MCVCVLNGSQLMARKQMRCLYIRNSIYILYRYIRGCKQKVGPEVENPFDKQISMDTC